MMIKNQFQVAEAIDNPVMFNDDAIARYRKGANPMVDPRTAEAEQNRRGLIRNLVQGMMARNNVAAQQQQGGGQMPTIVEIEKQKMAQQQAMQQQLIDALTSAGVGSLPTKPDMFSQGGGVVAFNGQDNEQFIQTSPEETAPPSGGGGKSIFQRVGEIFRPRNTYLQRPDNAVADQAIDIIKQVEGQIGVGDVADIRDGRFGYTVEAITQRLLGKPVSPAKAKQADVRKAEKDATPEGDTKTDKKPSGEKGAGGQGIASLSRESSLGKSIKELRDKEQKILEGLSKDTKGEGLLLQRIKDELERSEKYQDLTEEQLNAVAKKRLDEMKAESGPLFEKMKANIAERKGEKVGMSDEERRDLFISRLGKRGPGWRNVFGESLEGDVLQKVKDRDLNRARQDALAKEEMELARAEMLEARGQRKEADEAKKLALQAHREAENLRRQQAQTEIGGLKDVATLDRRKADAIARAQTEGLKSERELYQQQLRDEEADRRAARRDAAQAARLSQPEIAKLYNFYIERGMTPQQALQAAERGSRVGTTDINAIKQIQADAAKNQMGQMKLLSAEAALKKKPDDPALRKAVEDAERQLYGGYTRAQLNAALMGGGGGIPAGANVMKFDIQGNPIK